MGTDWYSCDGEGRLGSSASILGHARGTLSLTPSRRSLLLGVGMGLLGWAGKGSALAEMALSPGKKDVSHDVLVVLFLRGGMDSMSLVVPYAEDNYYRKRPTLAIGAPKDRRSSVRALDLNGFFGLNSALGSLLPLYHEGKLAIVHGCGSDDHTRSHFEAMSTMERGLARDTNGPSSGWVARHLTSTERNDDSPLRAVAFGGTMPDSLRGATNAVALSSLSEFQLAVPKEQRGDFHDALNALYQPGKDEISHAGRETLAVLDSLNRLNPDQYRPSNGAKYPNNDLANGLRQVACLIRANLGLEVACLDKGGWDTHVAQAGLLPGLMDDLGGSLAAFATDLGPDLDRVTVVAMSEFGRRLGENSGLGTDHGRGGALFLMGGSVNGGQVFTRWPGLEDHQLDETGDLVATIDYRDILGEVLARRMRNDQVESVFAGYQPKMFGLLKDT